MRIFNHNIRSSGPEWLALSRLYASRALCITQPGDVIQLPQMLLGQWPAILAHYERIGLQFTREVIWDLRLERIKEYPEHFPSLYFFGDEENRIFPDKGWHQTTRLLNSKNDLIALAEKTGVAVPLTQCFDRVDDIDVNLLRVDFPFYLKPARLLSGMGISRCENQAELKLALAALPSPMPVQIQKEVMAEAFLSIQYLIWEERVIRLLTTQQLLEGNKHKGNRSPVEHSAWEELDGLAEQIQRMGMKGFFAFDVAVVKKQDSVSYQLIECNPRFTAASYPDLLARKLKIVHWCTVILQTVHRELEQINLSNIEYNPTTKEGVILINWGCILQGKLMVMFIGSQAHQEILLEEFKRRI